MRGVTFALRGHAVPFASVLLLSLLVNGATALLTPVFLERLFDRGVAAKDMPAFLSVLGCFVALTTACRLLNLVLNLRTQSLKQRVFGELAQRLLRKYYRLPYREASRYPPGYFASRMHDEPLAASAASIELALELAGAAATVVVATALLGRLSGRATALLAVCVPLLLLLAGRFGAAVKRQAEAEKEQEGLLRGFLTLAAQAYRSVNMFALGETVASGLSARLDGFTRASMARVKSSSVHNAASGVLMSYAETLVLVACGFEMMQGRMSFGGFMGFMAAFWSTVGALRALSRKVPELSRNEALVGRIREFLEAPEPPSGPVAESASLSDVSFAYGDEAVLSGLSVSIGRGEKVLLSGPNGSGKSTLAHILARFLSPSQGEARLPELGKVSACLTPQHLIPGTVADNLRHAALSARQRDYVDSLLADFGLQGTLERDPEQLSSGQRKKLELVMGLMKDAELYVFDEPLANIDAPSKALVMRRILERTRGKSLVLVMHGDDELKGCVDKVIELGAPRAALTR